MISVQCEVVMIFTVRVCVCSMRSCFENIDGSYQPANADKELNVYLKACRLHMHYVSLRTHASMPTWRKMNIRIVDRTQNRV